jgi:hypothetical protein
MPTNSKLKAITKTVSKTLNSSAERKENHPSSHLRTFDINLSSAHILKGHQPLWKQGKHPGEQTLAHWELCDNILAASDQWTTAEFNLNPSASFFPYLSQQARLYEFVKFKKLYFRFISNCSGVSAGTVTMALNLNPEEASPTTFQTLNAYENSVTGSLKLSEVRLDVNLGGRPFKSTATDTSKITSTDPYLSMGKLVVGVQGSPASAGNLKGFLICGYEVELYRPELQDAITGLDSVLDRYSQKCNLGGTSPTAAVPFGTAPENLYTTEESPNSYWIKAPVIRNLLTQGGGGSDLSTIVFRSPGTWNVSLRVFMGTGGSPSLPSTSSYGISRTDPGITAYQYSRVVDDTAHTMATDWVFNVASVLSDTATSLSELSGYLSAFVGSVATAFYISTGGPFGDTGYFNTAHFAPITSALGWSLVPAGSVIDLSAMKLMFHDQQRIKSTSQSYKDEAKHIESVTSPVNENLKKHMGSFGYKEGLVLALGDDKFLPFSGSADPFHRMELLQKLSDGGEISGTLMMYLRSQSLKHLSDSDLRFIENFSQISHSLNDEPVEIKSSDAIHSQALFSSSYRK